MLVPNANLYIPAFQTSPSSLQLKMPHSHNHARSHEGHLPLSTWETRLIGRKLVQDGTNYKLADDSVCTVSLTDVF